MLSLNDPLWQGLEGGYRTRYDASTALRRLEREPSNSEVWDELFQELHHQGDVGVASYAAVPHLVRICVTNNYVHWHTFGLVGIIESERHRARNPTLPNWLETDYHEAIRELFRFGFAHVANPDNEGRIAFLSITAFALNLPLHGQMLLDLLHKSNNASFRPKRS